MKVLHINSYFSGSNFYKNLYDKQIDYGLKIDVYVPVPSSSDSVNLMLGDYTTISANHGKYDRFLFHLKQLKIYKDILNVYKIKNYSVIHAHSLFSNGYIALKLKENYGIPYIVAVRNTDVNMFFKYMVHLRKLGLKILQGADKIIFLSEPYKNAVINGYVPNNLRMELLKKVEIVPNGIDNFWFENRGDPKEICEKRSVKLLYVGIINKNKNLISTVKSVRYLINKGYDITFTIVGRIEDDKIYQQIKGISFVNYISPQKKDELLSIYRSHDIFVMPSKTETFGLVYAEAMSQGLPLIYTLGQGFDGQFAEGTVGFHVNPLDEKEIADRICEIINRYSEISYSCIENCNAFNWDEISERYFKIYKSIY